ncbi:MAG: ABC transporter permease subunit [Rickettsiaceae bacterium]|nr:ABC transporter permease subunit [Rickettsiaceae bacterium]
MNFFFKSGNFAYTKRDVLFDFAAFLIIISLIVIICTKSQNVEQDLTILKIEPVALDYSNLFQYSIYTSMRMLVALLFSIFFAVIYGLIAAKSTKLELILVPLLDVLQSVPVLGFISFTVTGFLAMFPGKVLGAELAVIFAIFTSQAWNIAFSAYLSFKKLPSELAESAKIFKLNAWSKFWVVELPYAIPGIVWNIVVSLSGGWFFIVASEVITVGDKSITLPGIGSYIALSIVQKNSHATFMAIFCMVIVILLYDQLFLKPLIAWSDKFKYDSSANSSNMNRSFVLDILSKSKILKKFLTPLFYLQSKFAYLKAPAFLAYFSSVRENVYQEKTLKISKYSKLFFDIVSYGIIICVILVCGVRLFVFIDAEIDSPELFYVIYLACLTWLRISILIIIVSVIWIPAGVFMGLNPRISSIVQPLTQFLAAFPVNLLFPLAAAVINFYNLDPNIWLSPLMIVGTQWYILFNVVAAASAIPNDLRDAMSIFKVRGIVRWRKCILPAIMPHYITGAITAFGASWNASIVSEVINYGNQTIVARGLGSYISDVTIKADFPRIALGISVMAFFVVVLNRIFWQPLHDWSIKRI